jgi:hypothetical protein
MLYNVYRGAGVRKSDRMIPQDRLALSKNSDKCDITFSNAFAHSVSSRLPSHYADPNLTENKRHLSHRLKVYQAMMMNIKMK